MRRIAHGSRRAYVRLMGKVVRIGADLDESVAAELDQLAGEMHRSREELIAEAISRYLDDAGIAPPHVQLGFNTPEAMAAFVQEGIDSADRGELVPQAEVERLFDEMIAFHRARQQ